jgi:hypothetical protein
VLSAINRIVADSGFNIVGQHLGTQGDVGLLAIDVAVENSVRTLDELVHAVEVLNPSIRTMLIGS